ncbi:hypothetical protein EC973_002951 [Apophysomyces ossiformis]|uniref:Heterokaryon incompatibility domain-containing protein n=1 Tax=Apophysomyces ossiformis TaxID=679940 RepID=A0A8H7BM80_9FUNG|nr:hypothetical protein EC973_002951 [Apophysomyces ossiformis]
MHDIVLLDTKSTYWNIVCVSEPFDENVPDYYAVSYRWGEHVQWRVQTPEYVAFVTSMSRGNLIELCELCRDVVPYLWIDAICINQSDMVERKKAIKNMDDIYRLAKRIVAVPDLCYCYQNPRMQGVTREDIYLAMEEISRNEIELSSIESMGRAVREQLRIRSLIGAMFICEVIHEWACRCWVISERTIGVSHDKLDIIILRASASIPYRLWKQYLPIDWSIEFDQIALVRAIINSKSTKYIDRLFAILPHTKYLYAVPRLVDEGITIENMIDLKMALFDILDMDGKMILLQDQLLFDAPPYQFPSFLRDKEFQGVTAIRFWEYYSNIEAMIFNGNYALRVSGPYTVPSSPQVSRKSVELLGDGIEAVIDVLLAVNLFSDSNKILLRCVFSNGICVADSIQDLWNDPCNDFNNYGEFVIL